MRGRPGGLRRAARPGADFTRSTFCCLWKQKVERIGIGGTRCLSVAAWFFMTAAPEGVRCLFSRPGWAEHLSQPDAHWSALTPRGAAAGPRVPRLGGSAEPR